MHRDDILVNGLSAYQRGVIEAVVSNARAVRTDLSDRSPRRPGMFRLEFVDDQGEPKVLRIGVRRILDDEEPDDAW